MPGSKARSRIAAKPQFPRIRPTEAAHILEQLGGVFESSGNLLWNLRSAGFGQLLARLDDRMLQLAVQPDSWGERTRARLMSEIGPALGGDREHESVVGIEDIVRVANIVMPCLLLEIGRRKQHLQIEFPANPVGPDSRLRFRAGTTHPVHSISNEQLQQLVTVAGETLVGLCYFGDQESRIQIEAEVEFQGFPRLRQSAALPHRLFLGKLSTSQTSRC